MVHVKVEQGWLEGQILDNVTGYGQYYSFKGIPYAAPPVGTLRFKAPEPPLPWEGFKRADKHGNVCSQVNVLTNWIIPGSEDCLYLNVYTKNLNPEYPQAVMMYIHGGTLKTGLDDETLYGPDFLVNHDVVLVTINYRLDALGFLCLDTKDVPGNAGLKDQVAALKWIKRNIRQFGGDPENVTIFGEGAGGAATAFHVLSPMSEGLFARAIPMSGAPLCDWAFPVEPRRRAFKLGRQLGFETDDAHALLEFLQSVPVERLIGAKVFLHPYEEKLNMLQLSCFTPVAEKDFGQEMFMSTDPLTALKEEEVNDVDVLMGFTSMEALLLTEDFEKSYARNCEVYRELLLPNKLLATCTPKQALDLSETIHKRYFDKRPINPDTSMKEIVAYTSEMFFVSDILRFFKNLPEDNGTRKFLYRFSCVTDRNIFGVSRLKYGLYGASHADNITYLFHSKLVNFMPESDGYEKVQLVCKLFTNFAKFGNPTPDVSLGVIWEEYDDEGKTFLDIGHELTPGHGVGEDSYNFWKKLYKSVHQPF